MDKEILVKLNKLIVDRSKEKHHVLNSGNLDFAAHSKTPEQLMTRIIHGHIFEQGNKRTALAAAQLMCRQQKRPIINVEPTETYIFFKTEAARQYHDSEVKKWLKKHQSQVRHKSQMRK